MKPPKIRRARRSQSKAVERESAGSFLRFILLLAVIAWAFRSFALAPFNIPSGSMLPALYIGDYLAVAKWPYGYSRYSFPFAIPPISGRIFGSLPKRGDVVVFRHPSENEDLIKRVIALPGDTVAVRNGALILNGRRVQRRALPPLKLPISPNSSCRTVPPSSPLVATVSGQRYCVRRAWRETLPGGPSYAVIDQVDQGPADDFPATRVPPGHVFLMGDNRDDSLDSRFPTSIGGVGMVPVDHLVGRAMVTFWSTDGSASYWKPWTWFTALRADRIGNGYSGDSE